MTKNFSPYYCNETFVDIVLPEDRIVTDETGEWFIIGYAGVDGITFRAGIHENDSTIYAFYPLQQEYVKVADSADDLIAKWKDNQVHL